MLSTLTYPGVYIEELPSGTHTITGVSTSVTAFIGVASRGPVNTPVVINSFADFERAFGGLWLNSYLSYAVRDFYLNGGSQAIIVRVCGNGASKAIFEISCPPPNARKLHGHESENGPLILEAADEGKWGNNLKITIDHPDSARLVANTNDTTLTIEHFFNLTIVDLATNTSEQYFNLTLKDIPQRIDRVLANASNLLRVSSNCNLKVIEEFRPDAVDKMPPTTNGTDGADLTSQEIIGSPDNKTGIYALEKLEKSDIFNLLCIPPYKNSDVDPSVWIAAVAYCEKSRAFLVIDSPSTWKSSDEAKAGIQGFSVFNQKNAAIYFPHIKYTNPLRDNQLETFVPCGAIAGVYSRIDAQRGVWKAPAGLETTINGALQLSVPLTDAENGKLNTLGLNCLRSMPAAGPVVWGARTLCGDDRLTSEWKYIPVRRLALYIEESLYRGSHWIVFQPNDESLWRQITVNFDSFMNILFRQGAFQGVIPKEAYFVKCDRETTTQADIDRGIVNIIVGFAPLKPSEFVVIKLQQIAGQTQ